MYAFQSLNKALEAIACVVLILNCMKLQEFSSIKQFFKTCSQYTFMFMLIMGIQVNELTWRLKFQVTYLGARTCLPQFDSHE